jgi:hypothetical protein
MTPVEIFQPYYGDALARWISRVRRTRAETAAVANAAADTNAAAAAVDAESSADGVVDDGSPLFIYEVGGGNGTCANNILSFLQRERPDLYARTHYTVIEMSVSLTARQGRLLAHHNQTPASAGAAVGSDGVTLPRYQSINCSVVDWPTVAAAALGGGSGVRREHCFVIGLEVLDNMPHDKVVYVDNDHAPTDMNVSNTDSDSPFEGAAPRGGPQLCLQTMVRHHAARSSDGKAYDSEFFTPITDPLIEEYLSYMDAFERDGGASSQGAAESSSGGSGSRGGSAKHEGDYSHLNVWTKLYGKALRSYEGDVCFVPTVALQFLHVLHKSFKKHDVFLADFDFLPGALNGENAPCVAIKEDGTGGKTVDAHSYLVRRGLADVFFPTNFGHLRYVYNLLRERATSSTSSSSSSSPVDDSLSTRPAVVVTQQDFMRRYSDHRHTRLRFGFNPLLDDFSNTKILISSGDGDAGVGDGIDNTKAGWF